MFLELFRSHLLSNARPPFFLFVLVVHPKMATSQEDELLLASVRAAVEDDMRDYFDAMRGAGDRDSDGYETPNSGDDDASGQALAKWANSVSPLRGKAPLSLSHRNSVQRKREGGRPKNTVSGSDGGWKSEAIHQSEFTSKVHGTLGCEASFVSGTLCPGDQTGLQVSVGDDAKQCLWLVCFDLLSALRGAPCSFFAEVVPTVNAGPAASGPPLPKWTWAGNVVPSQLKLPPSTFILVNRILEAADRVSLLRVALKEADDHDPCATYASSEPNACVERCGRQVLDRFLGAARLVMDRLDDALLQLQESWDFVADDPTLRLIQQVDHIEDACGFLLNIVRSASLTRTDAMTSARAARLVDVCTLLAARAQASGNKGLLSKSLCLLLLCSWPYNELFVPTIHGENQPLDRTAWLNATPKVFRTSFQSRCLDEHDDEDMEEVESSSTDVLSLVVSCEGIADKQDRRGRHSNTRRDLAGLLSTPLQLQQHVSSGDINAMPIELDEILSLRLYIVDTPLEHGYCLGTFGNGSTEMAPEGYHRLAVNTAIPFSHWLTITLLLPFAAVVQSFHHANLNALLTSTPSSTRIADDLSDEVGAGKITFDNALCLIKDVVLCAAWEQVVDTFLERCTAQGHWWYRSSKGLEKRSGDTAGPVTELSSFAAGNHATASKHLSAHFLDAARSLPFGQYVRLSVLPASSLAQKGEASAAEEILATFEAMRLVFTFPENIGIVLTPQQYYGNVTENYLVGDPYSRMFSFLCSFAYAKKVLLLRWKEQHHAELRSFSGIMRPASSSRGEATNNHQMAFLCETVLRFTQHEAMLGLTKLKKRLIEGDPRSVSAVCQFVDSFQLQIGVLCVAPSTAVVRDTTFVTLRKLYWQLLRVALDNNASADYVSEQVRNIASGIVSTLESLPEGSSLGQRLRPILLHLTFNKFY